MYVIHLVPNAPSQRIFYEIYRDRAAFNIHESQPYMRHFVAEGRSCVLATNVIELRLKDAMVAPLPNPQPFGPARRTRPRERAPLQFPPPRQTQRSPVRPPFPPDREPLPPGSYWDTVPAPERRYGGIY